MVKKTMQRISFLKRRKSMPKI